MSLGSVFARRKNGHFRILLVFTTIIIFTPCANAADAVTDWQNVTALDAGPAQSAESTAAMRANVLAHLARQEKALRDFLAAHPTDEHVFEARIRLSRLLQIRGDMEGSEALAAESRRILAELEKTASPAQRVEVDFAKIAARMRTLRQPTMAQREELLAAARGFQTDHPADRRVAPLLAEIATLFSAQPKTMEALLTDAQALATDEELKSRVADDLRRVRLFGTEISLRVTTLPGSTLSTQDLLGKPAILVFFASFSPPSLIAVASVQRAVGELPAGSVRVLGISLDATREQATALAKARGISWPIVCEEKGWDSPLARSFGINALPTVWLLDARGRLRSLNGLNGTAAQVRQLLREGGG